MPHNVMLNHDVVIIGAGMRAALTVDTDLDIAMVSKIHPLRSLSGTAQGGIAATFSNARDDSWESHALDTIKAGDFLSDQDSVEIMAKEAQSIILQLE